MLNSYMTEGVKT